MNRFSRLGSYPVDDKRVNTLGSVSKQGTKIDQTLAELEYNLPRGAPRDRSLVHNPLRKHGVQDRSHDVIGLYFRRKMDWRVACPRLATVQRKLSPVPQSDFHKIRARMWIRCPDSRAHGPDTSKTNPTYFGPPSLVQAELAARTIIRQRA